MIRLDYRDARPIYEQVRDGLRHLVVMGAIGQGEAFPPVGALAASLAINPNTIRRAYLALEEEGYLVSRPGEGAFAAQGTEDGERRRTLLRQFDSHTRELLFLGMSVEELGERVRALKEGAGSPRPTPDTQPAQTDEPMEEGGGEA